MSYLWVARILLFITMMFVAWQATGGEKKLERSSALDKRRKM